MRNHSFALRTPSIHVIILSCLLLLPMVGLAQEELNYPVVRYGPETITASWVSHPDIAGGEDRAVLFRNTFMVKDSTQDLIINISADNHYFLYVNGRFITHGPQLSDIQHYKYETLNLKDFIRNGSNVLALKVVNFGKRRFLGMQSIFTSVMVNGVTENAKALNTTGAEDSWRCMLDDSYTANEVVWRGTGEKAIVGGFYANNPTDIVDFNAYPTGWEMPGYDDAEWQHTEFFENASSMGGSIAYLLEPRNLPLLSWDTEAMGSIVRSTEKGTTNFPVSGTLTIEPHSTSTLLIDQKYVTNGFPELVFSKGRWASIRINYAENLFGPNQEKADRNDIEGKTLLGYYDLITSNGKEQQKFIPNWMRTYRFIELEITTKEEALTLNRFINHRSRTTLPSYAQFISDNELYNEIFEICKRTVDICTQDYFLSDAYYETMQYVGDTKIHALIWEAMSGNADHTRNAIRQFHHSRDADGNILGAYPLRSTFIYPTYSLVWISMIADHYKTTGDKNFIHTYKDGIVHTLAGFERNMNPKHLVKKTPYRYFIDWYTGPNNGSGTATNNDGENSAVVSLHYVHALQLAAQLFSEIGDTQTATTYTQRATTIKKAVYDLCYDTERKLFAERPDKTVYDQHTNIMAILTDAIAPDKQQALLVRILNDKDLLQATYYYRFYLFKAIEKINAPELFHLAQRPWEQMVYDHMTTTLERFESAEKPTRSEVHPWSASPAYFYFNYLGGIKSVKNNFEEVRIAPVFGVLNTIDGLLPTPKGAIAFSLSKKDSQLTAQITLPKNITGNLIWQGTVIDLKHGAHTYTLKPKNQ
ncbi:alpha-L-rhamnosidase C-terminal domain-containing protein [Maribacter sp. MAR_2009_72]|uniref:alpha-L-rhamnosidase-related protein n=1 Tax=Maribacter sp. MAR_2009_72 TaxID=1250050 RepID=UPI00119C2662|nr:family 78 glycoside hydrolase catalytic domain [Maribacter sp. MAR_2009_72]TVZ15588.1 alpha-L-rhamnosidase-like protein [Maribacter sp. MAR_2009_72]